MMSTLFSLMFQILPLCILTSIQAYPIRTLRFTQQLNGVVGEQDVYLVMNLLEVK